MIIEEYNNPVHSLYVRLYNSLSEEQQIAFDSISDLPRSERYLIPIKRQRTPDIRIGTVFAMQLPNKLYLYGKVIAFADSLPMIKPDFFIVLIGKHISVELENPSQEMNPENILQGPWIIGSNGWKNGSFFSVGHSALTDTECNLDLGFCKPHYVPFKNGPMKDQGKTYDIGGKEINHNPDFVSMCGYITIDGIETEIHRQMILRKIPMCNDKEIP